MGDVVDWLIGRSRAIIKVLSTLSLEPLIMAIFLPVECPHCHSTDVVKHGRSSYNGKAPYRCCNLDCPRLTFSLNLNYPGRNPEVKKQIVEMTLNGSGIRDIA
jgi:transposase-like protein